MQIPGLVNVDFADVRAVMVDAGTSLMGQGRASGKGRAKAAALEAIQSPLLDIGAQAASGIVWNITGPPDLTLFEVRAHIGIITTIEREQSFAMLSTSDHRTIKQINCSDTGISAIFRRSVN